MKLFQASSSNVEVNGETIYSVIDGMGAFKATALKILKGNGIDDPQKGSWYKQQNWLNAFLEISEKVGALTLFNIGLSIPKNAKFPPEINDIHKGLSSIDIAYHMNHRGGEIGNYKYEKINETSARIICDNPYPDDFDKGIITAICRKFVANTNKINVTVDPGKPIRSNGDLSTTFLIKWD